mmetsp:Transcript_72044/g.105591  ORF Transcript_72044/g.105591 Transcript_72044/m.105591 type:complete len:314 (-) Transcript_72044:388-1329(-)
MASQGQEAFAEAISAGLGGAFSSSALYPIEIVKNRLQTSQKKQGKKDEDGKEAEADSMSSVANDLYRESGMGGFYKGFQYSAMQSATEKAIYFYGYTYIVRSWKLFFGDLSTGSSLLCGCLAEWVHLPISLPIDAVTVRIQTGKGGSNPLKILRDVIKEGGISGLYSGWTAYLVLCLKPAITYALFDALKKLILRKKTAKGATGSAASTLTALEAFLIGAIARAVATIAVFPYTRAKIIVKSTKTEVGQAPPTIGGTVARIIKTQGFFSLYKGCAPEVGRGVLSAALMLSAKEKIAVAVRVALLKNQMSQALN